MVDAEGKNEGSSAVDPSPQPDSAAVGQAGAQLKTDLIAEARGLGFARLGIAQALALEPEATYLRNWLQQGYHASLDYMKRTVEVRANPQHPGMLNGAQSIVVLATPYGAGAPSRVPPGRIARYARDRDYHNVLHRRLRKLARPLRAQGHVVRAAVDSMPVFERAWAQRAGVGFIGKNCCLIVPGLGSHVFLSALVTTAQLPPDTPMQPRCGTCSACLRDCPTGAFVAPYRLNAGRCIAYQTIEHAGPIPKPLRRGLQDWAFGCDACQDACPFNRGHGAAQADEAFGTSRSVPGLEAWLTLSQAELEQALAGSPLRRAGRVGLARNAAVVLGNRGERRHLPLLKQVAAQDGSETVREAAGWAVGEIEQRLRSR